MASAVAKDNATYNLDFLVEGVAKLSDSELDIFFNKLNRRIINVNKVKIQEDETTILKQIKNLIPVSVNKTIKNLQEKVENETISPKEYEDLLFLIDYIDDKNLEKIQLLSKLAELRQISVNEVLKQFSLKKQNA